MSLELRQRDTELEAILSRYMNGCVLRGPVHAFQRTGSTMEDARALIEEGAPEGTLLFAAYQAEGRGRLGRVWESPDGGAYFSIVLRPSRGTPEASRVGEEAPRSQTEGRPRQLPSDLPQLSLVAGLAVAEGIRQLTGLHASIRWPNDVLIEGKKLAGILVEARGQNPRAGIPSDPVRASRGLEATTGAVIVGVGVNVAANLSDLPDTATSLLAAAARCPSPHQVVGAVWRRFSTWYDVWRREGFAPIREALRPWMGHFGQPVHIAVGISRFEGTASDLDEGGRLLVRLDSGLIRAFEMGEVTLLR